MTHPCLCLGVAKSIEAIFLSTFLVVVDIVREYGLLFRSVQKHLVFMLRY